MQFGGRPFNTAALTLDQWMWCILFGVGVLVWGQIITTIPTKRIPKQFSWGSGPPDEMIDATSSLVEDGSSGSLSQDVKRTGQILWIRGLTRLQTQVCLIQLHNSTVSQQLSLKRQSLGSPTSPTSLAAAAVASGSASLAAAAAAAAAHSAPHSAPSAGGDTASQIGSTSAGQQTHRASSALPAGATSRPDTIEEGPELPGEVPQPSASSERPRATPTRRTESTQGTGPSAPPPGAPPGRPYRPPAPETPLTETKTKTATATSKKSQEKASPKENDPLESRGASRGAGAGASVPIAARPTATLTLTNNNTNNSFSSEPPGSSAVEEEEQLNGDEQDMR